MGELERLNANLEASIATERERTHHLLRHIRQGFDPREERRKEQYMIDDLTKKLAAQEQ